MRRVTLLLIVVIVGGVTAAAYTLKVTEVRVTGLRTLAAADVIRGSNVEPGQRILWIRLSAAARAVERIPGVRRATATRSLPGTVVIHVTERQPLVKLAASADLVADSSGRIFQSQHHGRLPTLEGWRTRKGSRRAADQATRAALRAFEAFPPELRTPVERIVARPFTLVMKGGLQVRFGRIDRMADKAAAALAVLRAEHGKPLLYVDVQVPTVPVVGPPPTPTPAPTPTPFVPASTPVATTR